MATVEQSISGDSGLSKRAYVGYAAAFMIIPYACVLASSALYYRWRRTRPVSAKQINKLGFIIFGLQMLLACLLAWLTPAKQGEMPAPSPAGIMVPSPAVAATGTLVPFSGKPFQISAPPRWMVGDNPGALGFDVEITDPSQNIIVQASAFPIIDVSPAHRDTRSFNDFWRKSLGPELTGKEDLSSFQCSLLGHRVEAQRTDYSLPPADGGRRVRQVRVVAAHANHLVQLSIVMPPSLAEEVGEDAVQSILAWLQATGPGNLRRRDDGLESSASPISGDRAAAVKEFMAIRPRTQYSKAFLAHWGRDEDVVEEFLKGVDSGPFATTVSAGQMTLVREVIMPRYKELAAREYENATDESSYVNAIESLTASLEPAINQLLIDARAKAGGLR